MDRAWIQSKIEQALPGILLEWTREALLIRNPPDLIKVLTVLKNDPALSMDYLSSVTAADYLDHLESVYHLYSMSLKTGPLVIRVRLNRKDPRLPSVTPLYRSAEFQEREAYDLFGIIYEDHPNLSRIFMWDEFHGFPLRKDYEQEDADILEPADIEWLDRRGIRVPEEMRKQAEALKKNGERAKAQKVGPK